MARKFGDGVAVIEPADLAADAPVVLVVFGLAKNDSHANASGVLVEGKAARFHHREEGEDPRLGVLALYIAQVLVILIHGVLDHAGSDSGSERAEVLNVQGGFLFSNPGGQQVSVVVMGTQKPGPAAGVPHLAPLADQLPGVPIDALAGLFVQVQPDPMDVRSHVLLGITPGATNEGGERAPNTPELPVRP